MGMTLPAKVLSNISRRNSVGGQSRRDECVAINAQRIGMASTSSRIPVLGEWRLKSTADNIAPVKDAPKASAVRAKSRAVVKLEFSDVVALSTAIC